MHLTLIMLNLFASLASAGFALIALIRPRTLSRSNVVDRGETFYVRMYVARAVPVAVSAGLVPFWYAGVPVSLLVFTASLIQGADVLIALEKKQPGMIMGASIGMIIHLLCGLTTW